MKQKSSAAFPARAMACCALLAALSVVFARLLSFAPAPNTRWSFDKFPLFLAGMFFGPVAGGLTGFAADTVGCLFSPYGINPVFSVPAILYGLCGGLFRHALAKKPSLLRLILAYLLPVVLGSLLYQSAALAFVYNPATFWISFSTNLGLRGIQFALVSTGEIAAIYLLMKTRVFEHARLWLPGKE